VIPKIWDIRFDTMQFGMDSHITFSELLQYTERETQRWKEWFAAHPEALDVPCDIAKAGTVRALLLHVFATELFFAHLLLGLPHPDWTKLSSQSLEELFGINDEASRKFQEFIDRAQPHEWNEVKELGFGNLKGSKRKMAAQAFLHGVQHRSQMATLLRQQGFEGLWMHDLIATDVMA
jgi:uncharacterized damage-inducible protein DinB